MTDIVTFKRLQWVPVMVLVLWLLQITWWATDRATPFKVLQVTPVSVKAGETLRINARVWRDLSRTCDATITRQLLDSQGRRYDLEGSQQLTSQVIALLEKTAPGQLKLGITVPASMSPGTAFVITSLDYSCNSIHELWPIRITTMMPFEVLP